MNTSSPLMQPQEPCSTATSRPRRTFSVGVSASGRVHDSEVERVSRRSAALAWWSADAESDSERRGPGVCEARGYHAHHRTLRQVLVTCYGYR